MITISRIHTKILSDSHQKHAFLHTKICYEIVTSLNSVRFSSISVRRGDHAPFLETHRNSVRLGRSDQIVVLRSSLFPSVFQDVVISPMFLRAWTLAEICCQLLQLSCFSRIFVLVYYLTIITSKCAFHTLCKSRVIWVLPTDIPSC